MLRFPLARRALMGVTACSVVVLPVALSPTAARAEAPNPSACKALHHGNPPGSLTITSNPPSGTVLRPGDEVEVTATWDTADWARPVLHKVLNCLLVNGTIDYDRSTQEKPTDNDGLYRYRFTVPAGAEGRICDRVRLSGRLVDRGPLAVQKSNTVCFAVATAGKAATPATPPDSTTSAATPIPGLPAPGLPAPGNPAPGLPAPGNPAAPEPGPVAPAPASRAGGPAPAPEISSVAYRPTLPRTGSDVLPLARLGTLLVLLGGPLLVAAAGITGGGWRISRALPGQESPTALVV